MLHFEEVRDNNGKIKFIKCFRFGSVRDKFDFFGLIYNIIC